jgi:hypothetical protein
MPAVMDLPGARAFSCRRVSASVLIRRAGLSIEAVWDGGCLVSPEPSAMISVAAWRHDLRSHLDGSGRCGPAMSRCSPRSARSRLR